MAGITLPKTTTAFIICMYVAYLALYRPDSSPALQDLVSPKQELYKPRIGSTEDAKHLPFNKITTQQTYSNETNIKGKCIIPELKNYDQFFAYFEKSKAPCKNKEQVGGKGDKNTIMDGHKWVCFDNGFKPDDCIVYSFGINNEWSFDDTMDLKRHCKVYSFDPTMGVADHKRGQRISFYNLGISNYKGFTTKLAGKKCPMDRYKAIVEKLGHTSTVIDYLKMDIEGSEIPVFKDILRYNLDLLNNVRQIGMEIHPFKAGAEVDIWSLLGLDTSDRVKLKFKDYWEIFHRLECQGWRLLNAEMNQVPSNHYRFKGILRSQAYELVWIKS